MLVENPSIKRFSPLYLQPSGWYDAMAAETLTLDGSGRVTQWLDKSGNGKHGAPRFPSNPDFLTTYQSQDSLANHRPALRATNNTGLRGVETPSIRAQEVFVVASYLPGLNDFQSFESLISSGANETTSWLGIGQSGVSNWFNNASVLDTSPSINGNAESNNALPLPLSVIHFKFFLVTQEWAIGHRSKSSDRSWPGAIGEVLFFPSAVSDEDSLALLRHLATKWKISI